MMLFGTAVISGGMLIWPLVNRLSAGGVSQVSALEAVQLMNRRDAVVLEVRRGVNTQIIRIEPPQ